MCFIIYHQTLLAIAYILHRKLRHYRFHEHTRALQLKASKTEKREGSKIFVDLYAYVISM